MYVVLKIVSLLLSTAFFIGFGWWERSELNTFDKLYWLAPAASLLIIGIIPFRILSTITFMKMIFSALVILSAIQLSQGMYASWNSPIEPDTPAFILQAASIGVMIWALMSVWKKKQLETKK